MKTFRFLDILAACGGEYVGHPSLLEAAVIGNIVADFPLINKSINASYSGIDL